MPNEMETRTNEAGKTEIFALGEWKPLAENKLREEKDFPLDVSICISGSTFTGKARTYIQEGKKTDNRKAVAIKLDDKQAVYGGASFFLRV